MIGDFEVHLTDVAREDLERLFGFLVERAETIEDFQAAQRAIELIGHELTVRLAHAPFAYRKSARSAFHRELVIPFGASGYVAPCEIADRRTVHVLALRHQREEDDH